MSISRRGFLIGASALLAGCATNGTSDRANYGDRLDEKHPLRAMPLDKIKPELRRRTVEYDGNHKAGTVVVDTPARRLYYVLGNNRAIRYGVRVGRDGFTWTGVQKISRKAEWPDWRPPPEMLQRQPYLPRFMAGGPGNPMGARALYLGSTVFRIHGTNQPETIGQAISSGCFRLANGDIADLYDRVPVGTKVVIRHKAAL